MNIQLGFHWDTQIICPAVLHVDMSYIRRTYAVNRLAAKDDILVIWHPSIIISER